MQDVPSTVGAVTTKEDQTSPPKETLHEASVEPVHAAASWPTHENAFFIFVFFCASAGGVYYVRRRLIARGTIQGGRYTRVETSQV